MAVRHLSERLVCTCSLVSDGLILADIGTDHAYLPIECCRSGRTPSAIAADVRPGPLSRARAHVEEAHLEDRITCRLSDGFSAIAPGEVQSAVITGMGGLLICDILRRGVDTVNTLQELILGPQSEQEEVRRCVTGMGFVIDREEMVEEDRKFYVLIRFRRRNKPDVVSGSAAERRSDAVTASDGEGDGLTPEETAFGPYLLEHRNPVLFRFLGRRQMVLEGLLRGLSERREQESLSPAAEKRYSEIKEELRLIATAQKRYEK